jgi:hypothetical protein
VTKEELMALSAKKAARELTPESIEFLFQPTNYLELFLRHDFDGTVEKYGWMPVQWIRDAVDCERFYREIQNHVKTAPSPQSSPSKDEASLASGVGGPGVGS